MGRRNQGKRVVYEREKIPFGGLLAAVATILTGSWAADGIEGTPIFRWVPLIGENHLVSTSLALVFFCASIYWLYRIRHEFMVVRTLFQRTPAKSYSCIIMPISSPNATVQRLENGFAVGDAVINGTNLYDDIKALDGINRTDPNKTWNWQQILRGLRPHCKTAEQIYILGSPDMPPAPGKTKGMEGSFKSLSLAREIIRMYVPPEARIVEVGPIDFENLEAMVKEIDEIRKELRCKGFTDRDIIIDVTGGQKVASIVGALETLNKRITFQYVQTNYPYNTQEYDVSFQSGSLI